MVYRAARAGGPGRWTSLSRRRAGASLVLLLLLIGLGLWLAGCAGGPPAATRARATLPARWARFLHVPGVVDLTGPRGDGQLTVAAAGRLLLLSMSSRPVPFARGSGGYTTALGTEPYIAMPTGKRVTGLGCSFGKDATYALEPNGSPGVISIDKQGQARHFASLPVVRPDGIAFDDVGRFGYRLLVTATVRAGTTVFGVDCTGRVTTIASHAPRVEGGIAVAPLSFGSFGGDLVAPDETTGQIWAIGPGGKTRLIAESPLPAGGDIGVESAAFVPAGFSRAWAAYVADRRSPGNRHLGTNSILRLPGGRADPGGDTRGRACRRQRGRRPDDRHQLLRNDLHGPAHRGRAGGGPRRGPHRLRPAQLTQRSLGDRSN
jgi:hypothetical protein